MDLLPFIHMSAWLGLLMLRGAGGRLGRQPPVKCGGCQPIADWRARRSESADEAHELLFDDDAGHALHFGEAAWENGGGVHSAFS